MDVNPPGIPPDAVTLSAPGLCHNLPIQGHPAAGDATLLNGTPTVPVYLGTLFGRRVELDVTSLAEFEELARAVQLGHARLSMWFEDHSGRAA